MKINVNNHPVYGRISSVNSAASSKTTADAFESSISKALAQETSITSKLLMPTEDEWDAMLAQTKSEMQYRKASIAPAELTRSVSASSEENLVVRPPYVHYEKVESIYDIPTSELTSRLYEAVREGNLIDTDGMTKAEIYNQVQSIFEEYLGKDFLEPITIYSGASSSLSYTQDIFPIFTYQQIFQSLDSTLRQLGITRGCFDYQMVIEAKGFGGMSESDIRAAVRNKYPEKMNLKQCIMMSDELTHMGLDTSSYGWLAVENIFMTLDVNFDGTPNSVESAEWAKKVFDRMLEMPADFDRMKQAIDAYKTPKGNFHFSHQSALSKDGILKELFSWFGGNALYGTKAAKDLMELLMRKNN